MCFKGVKTNTCHVLSNARTHTHDVEPCRVGGSGGFAGTGSWITTLCPLVTSGGVCPATSMPLTRDTTAGSSSLKVSRKFAKTHWSMLPRALMLKSSALIHTGTLLQPLLLCIIFFVLEITGNNQLWPGVMCFYAIKSGDTAKNWSEIKIGTFSLIGSGWWSENPSKLRTSTTFLPTINSMLLCFGA